MRAEDTGKPKGFAFICYEDQRSTVLAVDNLNGAKVLGRTIRVEHVEDYRLKDPDAAKNGSARVGRRTSNRGITVINAADPARRQRTRVKMRGQQRGWVSRHRHPTRPVTPSVESRGREQHSSAAADEDDAMLRELKARKEAAMARAKAAAEGLPLPGADSLKEAKAEAKRAKKDAKRMKKEAKRRKRSTRSVNATVAQQVTDSVRAAVAKKRKAS